MKKLFTLFTVSFLVLFSIAFIQGCKKTEDPYAGYTLEREQTMIKDWLATMVTNKKDIDTTSTGLYYIVETKGTGATVKAGNTVKVKYIGMYLDGSVFDASSYYGDGTITYIHKDANTRMIQGWEEGIEVMNKGAKAAFLIPSAKGYGPTGNNSIPKNTPLIFIIEVVDIK
jgi:FKBP-type peptidyl-prolyl cis-trans isomerase